jgi:hypothetical protein
MMPTKKGTRAAVARVRKPAKPAAAKISRATKKTRGRPAAKAPAPPAERAFAQGLVARGEAVKVEPGQPLPSGATHEIVGKDEAGQPPLKRRRFSLT